MISLLLWLACHNHAEAELSNLLALTEQSAPKAALKRWAEAQASPQEADLLLLRAAVQRPEKGMLLCGLTRTATAQEKCRQVIGRPHLSTVAPK